MSRKKETKYLRYVACGSSFTIVGADSMAYMKISKKPYLQKIEGVATVNELGKIVFLPDNLEVMIIR